MALRVRPFTNSASKFGAKAGGLNQKPQSLSFEEPNTREKRPRQSDSLDVLQSCKVTELSLTEMHTAYMADSNVTNVTDSN